MSTAIRRLLDKLYPQTAEYTVTIFGEVYGGKTTLLYLLKLGEIVPTIASMGFNVETFEAPTTSGRPLRLTCWDFGAGCRAISYSLPYLAPYLAKSDAVIWIVDASEPQSLAENVSELTRFINNLAPERDSAKPECPILMQVFPSPHLANKQDRPNVVPISRLYEVFAKTLSGHSSCIFPTSLTAPMEKTGLPEAFEWLRFALQNASRGRKTLGVQPTLPDMRDSKQLEVKLDSWVSRAETEADDPDLFVSKFQTMSLPAWDHYTHIRIAFFILVMYGRQRGKDMIFQGIEKYITQSPQARGRTFHVTMTYFWIQIVHLGIRNMFPSVVRDETKASMNSQTGLASDLSETPTLASPHKFALFLALNPYVADGNLWMEYYSKDVMMSPAAKGGMVLPDKKQLPNLVVRDAIVKRT
ncbi:hypothetical protein H0H92_004375 [Tricholoma furcatifolium]|nr:hypothetical protein H0H92_004375 [Tricholoma furcatifolium]